MPNILKEPWWVMPGSNSQGETTRPTYHPAFRLTFDPKAQEE